MFLFYFFSTVLVSRQSFENRNSKHKKILCEIEQNSGFICGLKDSEDLLETKPWGLFQLAHQ